MKSLKIGFIADPFEHLNPRGDGTYHLMKKAITRKHKVIFIDADQIFYTEGKVQAHTNEVKKTKETLELSPPKTENLDTFDILLWRKDPPYNTNYIYTTFLLEQINKKVWIMNSPAATRNFNEKLATFQFKKFMPETLITKQENEIIHFLKKHEKTGIVIKPLDMKGGHGTYYIHAEDWNRKEIFRSITEDNTKYVMVQKFLEKVRKTGDRRHMLLGGKLLNSIARIPEKKNFRGNLSSGATGEKTKASPAEQKICTEIGEYFLAEGIHLIGLDMIDGFVTEINVTSPILGFQLYPENGDEILSYMEYTYEQRT